MLTPAGAKAEDRYGAQKVVYHVNTKGGEEDSAYRMVLRNVQNHVEAVGLATMAAMGDAAPPDRQHAMPGDRLQRLGEVVVVLELRRLPLPPLRGAAFQHALLPRQVPHPRARRGIVGDPPDPLAPLV